MASEIAVRKLSPEFWAIVGSAVTLLMALIASTAMILTIAGWHREDLRSMEAKLSSEIRSIDARVARIDKRLAVVESHVLGKRSIVEGEPSDETQTL